jgi:hypothetical protein
MQSTFVKSGDFTYTAELRPLSHPEGSCNLSVHSTWGGAKDPKASRTILQVTTDSWGLLALRDLILAEVKHA